MKTMILFLITAFIMTLGFTLMLAVLLDWIDH